MDEPLIEWEAGVFAALAGADSTGRLPGALDHLRVTARCDCCSTFDLHDVRVPAADLGVVPFARGTTFDGSWEFVLWTDSAGDPFCVEEVSISSGPLPAPSTLGIQRCADLRPI